MRCISARPANRGALLATSPDGAIPRPPGSTHVQIFRSSLALLFLAPLGAFAAKPAVPTYTVGAGFKQFQIDVNPVAGATSYELWFLANGNATWVKYMDSTEADPVFKVTVSTHLLDWYNARYRVAACNADGCSSTVKFAVTG